MREVDRRGKYNRRIFLQGAATALPAAAIAANTGIGIEDAWADDAFRAVVEAHRGLSDEQSADFDAALVLILANHIGDLDVLHEAIALAKRRMAGNNDNSSQART